MSKKNIENNVSDVDGSEIVGQQNGSVFGGNELGETSTNGGETENFSDSSNTVSGVARKQKEEKKEIPSFKKISAISTLFSDSMTKEAVSDLFLIIYEENGFLKAKFVDRFSEIKNKMGDSSNVLLVTDHFLSEDDLKQMKVFVIGGKWINASVLTEKNLCDSGIK